MDERRRYQRYVKTLPMRYDLERDGEWVEGTGQLITMDMSAGGARVRCPGDIKVGERLAVSTTIEGYPFTTPARVVWTSPSRVDGYVVAGLLFEDLDEAARDTVELNLGKLPPTA